MSETRKRTLILGAGFSGIVSLKSALEADLGDVVCYEQSYCIGGLWKYRKSLEKGQGSVIESTITNTSKEIMCFSDFDFPKEWPNFLRHEKVLEYIEDYVHKFDLRQHIILYRKVTNITRNEDATFTVKSLDVKDDTTITEQFDFIMVCNGRFFETNMVEFKDQSLFKGTIIHSEQFRDLEKYRGTSTCVVGIGNTALDIASDLAGVCRKVYVSTRSGTYIRKRISDYGLPDDCNFKSRYKYMVNGNLPTWYRDMTREKAFNKILDHELYGIKPKVHISKLFLTTNDEIQTKVISGAVEFRKDIARFKEHGIEFVDGSVETVDRVVMATGYRVNTAFLSEEINIRSDSVELYNLVFLPGCPNIAIIGYINPFGPIPPASEMQARYVVQVFKGNIHLPSEENMKTNIKNKKKKRVQNYGNSDKFNFGVNGYRYMDMLAKDIGCNINWQHLLYHDPLLAYHCIFGVYSIRQYRLYGPNACPAEARSSIMNVWNRVRYPFGDIKPRRTYLAFPISNTTFISMLILIVLYVLSYVYTYAFT